MKLYGCGKSVAIIAALTALTHCLVASVHGGPVAVPDVSAYLSVPQWLAGGVLPDPLHFFPGYGFLLAPAGWLDGADLHSVALVVNGLLAGGCVVGAALLANSYGRAPYLAVIAASLAALHPSLSTSSRIAWPETLLTAVLLFIALLLHKKLWWAAGLAAGLSLSIHPRAVVIVIAIAIIGVLAGRAKQIAGGLIMGLAISGLCVYMTGAWPWSRIDAATSPGSGYGLAETISGQWVALAATSGALAAIGLLAGLQKIWRRPEFSAESFLALSATGMIALGGIALAGSDRADTVLYSRYIGPWIVPLTVIGLVTFKRQRVTRQLTLTASALTLVGFLVVFLSGQNEMQGPRRIMTLGLGAIWMLFDDRLIPTLLATTGVAVLGIFFVRKSLVIPVIVFIALAISSTISNHNHLHNVGQIADGQASTADLVPSTASCLSHDASAKSYALWLYRLELPDIDHVRVDIAANKKPCGTYVVATEHILSHCRDAKKIGDEPRAKWGMWRYPSSSCG